jgi:predicted regulator of Ras-like GTPase activity (Roadblock/LC7/MglB family)
VITGSGSNDDTDVGQLLETLIRGTDSIASLLVRLDGTCLGVAGDTAQVNTTMMAFIVADMLSCCRDMALAVGEDGFSTIIQMGADRHVQMTLVGEAYALVVVFADDRQAGLVRLQAGRTAAALTTLLPLRTICDGNNEANCVPMQRPRDMDLIDRIFANSSNRASDPDSR